MTQPMPGSRVSIYSRVARALHWTTVALLAVQFPIGVYMVYRGKTLDVWDGLTGALYGSHKFIGLIVLLVVVWRLGYRLARGAPPDEPTIEPWQRVASHLTHVALYGLLVAVPVIGYVGISLFPALDIFGLFKLPALVAPDKQAAEAVLNLHGTTALLLAALVALHVGAALFHYVVRKDDVLGRMLPGLLRR
ncbi:MAG: cytochrome b [Lautropia sp.]